MAKHSRLRSRTAIAALLVLASASAWAQPRQPPPAAAPGADGCGSAQLQPRGDGADPQLQGKGGDNLSDRLAQSGGVICPPKAVDPAMKAPTPDTGDHPAIRPPVTGEGQSPQPK